MAREGGCHLVHPDGSEQQIQDGVVCDLFPIYSATGKSVIYQRSLNGASAYFNATNVPLTTLPGGASIDTIPSGDFIAAVADDGIYYENPNGNVFFAQGASTPTLVALAQGGQRVQAKGAADHRLVYLIDINGASAGSMLYSWHAGTTTQLFRFGVAEGNKYVPIKSVILSDGTLLLQIEAYENLLGGTLQTSILLAIYTSGEAEEILTSRQQLLKGAFGGPIDLIDGYGRVALLQIVTTGGTQFYRLHEE